ncbi:MFS general substrate transporter [Xylona heveae TC161]|uniref:MFS general substrate transporter n=1 Tax=Xylona heveae (strain CBS 132557 / TC161) TaxID=1328760 RepID=A0A165HME7_XYLHT|nr:MFS general substrate transporter [Xylona heveae TC161]KZF23732.1 MFS general substrate transporter [Xylona heveae TC161]
MATTRTSHETSASRSSSSSNSSSDSKEWEQGHDSSDSEASHADIATPAIETIPEINSEPKGKEELDLSLQQSQRGSLTRTLSRTMSRVRTNASRTIPPVSEEDDIIAQRANGRTVVGFELEDPGYPGNWSNKWKLAIALGGILMTLNSTLGSAMPSGAMKWIASDFHVTNAQQKVLPISTYLLGYVVGPPFLAPFSEFFGRQRVLLVTFLWFTAFTLGTALAPNWPAFLVFRFLSGLGASAPLTLAGGVYADCFPNPVSRGRVMAYFSAGTAAGPMVSPIIAGFLGTVSWRWAFWVELMFAGLTLPLVLFLPETFPPVILRRRAAKMRKEQHTDAIVAPMELEDKSLEKTLFVNILRSIQMFFTEPIVLLVCLYLAYTYALLYLFFESFPIIYQGIYGMKPGIAGLAYLPILIGACFAIFIVYYWDGHVEKRRKLHPDQEVSIEYRRLPLGCLGGPCLVISMFWIGWASKKSVHWMAPIVGGFPFGVGLTTIFISQLNYLGDTYEIFNASALAASNWSRSLCGALLPLAAAPMYGTLGVDWASSLLGFSGIALSAIPFIFMKIGPRVRAQSPFCQYLAEKRAAEQRKEKIRIENAKHEIALDNNLS